jgi:hypothetical protein
VIEVLRFVGLVNAAVWLGTAVFYSLGVAWAPFSKDMRELLGAANAPYYSGAIAHLLQARALHFQLVCSVIALAHVFGEWIYLGKVPRRWWIVLLLGLLSANLLAGLSLQPRLRELHLAKHAVNYSVEQRRVAARSYSFWLTSSRLLNLAILAGVGVYFWRTVSTSQPTRFASALKFRS